MQSNKQAWGERVAGQAGRACGRKVARVSDPHDLCTASSCAAASWSEAVEAGEADIMPGDWAWLKHRLHRVPRDAEVRIFCAEWAQAYACAAGDCVVKE